MHFLNLCAVVSTAAAASVLLPSQDPFYTQPKNITSYKPGEIIASRQVPPNLNGEFLDGVVLTIGALHQYLYRTTDSLGKPVAAVTSLLVPKGGGNSSQMVVWPTAYDAANIDCSPSYAFRAGSNVTSLVDIMFIAEALNQGWWVLAADYEGLQAQFTAPAISGYATLDSVRAAFHDVNATGLDPHAKYVMYGYSGGTIAANAAAELQPKYAPELNFLGVAMGGITPNLTSVLISLNGAQDSGIGISGIHGLQLAFSNLSTWLNHSLHPNNASQFYSHARACLIDSPSNIDFNSYFINGSASWNEPVPKSILTTAGQWGNLGTPSKKLPFFIHHALRDEVAPIADADKYVKLLCSKGVSVEYHRDLLGTHATESITGGANSLVWMKERFEGKKVKGGCETSYTILSALSLPSVFASLGQLWAILQVVLLGGELGSGFAG